MFVLVGCQNPLWSVYPESGHWPSDFSLKTLTRFPQGIVHHESFLDRVLTEDQWEIPLGEQGSSSDHI